MTVNVWAISGTTLASGANNFNLITAGGGLAAATYTLGTVYNDPNFTLSGLTGSSGTALSVTANSVAGQNSEYWKGGFSGGNSVWAISDCTGNSNWTPDSQGQTPTNLTPGPTTTVNFSATGAMNQGGTVLGAECERTGHRGQRTTHRANPTATR